MKTRDFREIQVSSSILVLIFLAVIALGVFIFLLGVNVGKKQVQMAAAQTTAEKVTAAEPVAAPGEVKTSVPEGAETAAPSNPSPAATEKIEPAAKQETPPAVNVAPPESRPASKPATVTATEGFFVQIGALDDQPAANSLAGQFRKQGYRALVLDPFPTDRTPLYRVRIGSYASRGLAEAALAKLNKAAGAGKRTGYYVTKG